MNLKILIPFQIFAEKTGIVRVVAGNYAGVKGAARTFTPITMLDVRLNAKGRADFSFNPNDNTALLLMKGSVIVNGDREVRTNDFVLFSRQGGEIAVEAKAEDAHLLILSGQPIDEPIAQYGPFVMNTESEIRQAITDFNAGKFGELDD